YSTCRVYDRRMQRPGWLRESMLHVANVTAPLRSRAVLHWTLKKRPSSSSNTKSQRLKSPKGRRICFPCRARAAITWEREISPVRLVLRTAGSFHEGEKSNESILLPVAPPAWFRLQ